jgi:hypothetical protein
MKRDRDLGLARRHRFEGYTKPPSQDKQLLHRKVPTPCQQRHCQPLTSLPIQLALTTLRSKLLSKNVSSFYSFN